jgi:glycosyltransferase involved in cell wall biosynthesis
MNGPLHVMWVGLRGFPGVQGGVETHAEHLCPMLRDLGCEVTVLTRRGYQPEAIGPEWHGVRFVNLWAPRHKHLEAVVHTFLAILYAGLVARPDLLHIQAIGPGLWTLWARLLGLRVVVTHHGPDYDRQKWGRLARLVLRLGEASAARWSDALIVISKVIQSDVNSKHGRRGALISNGITLPDGTPDESEVTPFGLVPGRYVLLVSRLVPEKRHHDLIDAFLRARPDGWKLAIVGGADHADAYARSVVEAARQDERIVFTGFQTGSVLQALYAEAGLFVLPSSHEGLPIAILEALSWGVPVLASDIPANLEVGLPADNYYPLGDLEALSAKLARFAAGTEPASAREARRQWAAARFDWQRSARETVGVYARVMEGASAWPEASWGG